MRRRFAGFNVILDQEPLEIFAAARGTDFFADRLAIAERNAASRLFDYPASLVKQRGPLESLFSSAARYYRRAVGRLPVGALYAITFHAWLLRLLHGLSCADLIVDADLALAPDWRRALADRIEAACGARLDLAPAVSLCVTGPPEQAAIEREVLDCLPMSALEPFIDRARIARRLGEIAPRKAAMIDRIL